MLKVNLTWIALALASGIFALAFTADLSVCIGPDGAPSVGLCPDSAR